MKEIDIPKDLPITFVNNDDAFFTHKLNECITEIGGASIENSVSATEPHKSIFIHATVQTVFFGFIDDLYIHAWINEPHQFTVNA